MMDDMATLSSSVSTVRMHSAERVSDKPSRLNMTAALQDIQDESTESPNLSPVYDGSTRHSPSFDSSLSESSLPSVSSSFFFSSSAAASPGRSANDSDPHSESVPSLAGHDLIIPSLTLPPALKQPTTFGQTLGNLRLLVLGAQGAGKSFLTGFLLEDNEDVVDVGTWENWEEGADSDGFGYGKVLKASTDWVERRDIYGSEKYEPTRNIHIVELPGYSQDSDSSELIKCLKNIIDLRFRALHDILHPDTSPSAMVSTLLASPTSPLYTAMVFLLPSSPTLLDLEIISDLSTHIPLIVLPRLHGPHRESDISPNLIPSTLSSFQPTSSVALRNGLFHSPETIALLRIEAVDRFLRWREVEKSVNRIVDGGTGLFRCRKRRFEDADEERWDKGKWEAEWLANFSSDVDCARRKREATITQDIVSGSINDGHQSQTDSSQNPQAINNGPGKRKNSTAATTTTTNERPYTQRPSSSSASRPVFDPLDLPSLFALSISLLGPLKTRLGQSVQDVLGSLGETRIRVALLGGFCIGFGVGFGLFASR